MSAFIAEADWGGLVIAAIAAVALGLSVFQEWRHHQERRPDQYLHVRELDDGRGLELDLRITNRRPTRVALTLVRLWPSRLWQVELANEESYLRAGKPDPLSSSVAIDGQLSAHGTIRHTNGEQKQTDRIGRQLLAFRVGRWPAWLPLPLFVTVILETRGAVVRLSKVRFRRWVRVAQVEGSNP
jgi:hypothetical protein